MVTGRILDVPPYNTYTMSCVASSRVQSILKDIPQTISWSVARDGGAVMSVSEGISTEMVDVGTSSSVLSVTINAGGEYVYTCGSSLDLGDISDTVEGDDSTTVTVIGELWCALESIRIFFFFFP